MPKGPGRAFVFFLLLGLKIIPYGAIYIYVYR